MIDKHLKELIKMVYRFSNKKNILILNSYFNLIRFHYTSLSLKKSYKTIILKKYNSNLPLFFSF